MNIYLSHVYWPHRELWTVPGGGAAEQLAAEVRLAFLRDPFAPLLDLKPLCRAGRFKLIERELAGVEGGGEAMLLPERGNRFEIWVDPEPRGGWARVPGAVRKDLRRHRLRFRVAHEMAHSFFYARGPGEPRRIVPDSDAQERFADAFATNLLLPSVAARRVAPSPAGILALQRAYDVSLEVALKAVVSAHATCVAGLVYWPAGSEISAHAARVQWSSPGSSAALPLVRECLAPAKGRRERRHGDAPDVEYLAARRQALWVAAPNAPRRQRGDRELSSAA